MKQRMPMKSFLHITSMWVALGAIAPFGWALTTVLPPDIDHTELHRAAGQCDAGKIREALAALSPQDAPAEINRLDREGYTALAYAAQAGCLEVVKILLEAGASTEVAESFGGWTPLLHAAIQCHAEVVKYLLEHGANPNAKTNLGKTPLSVALTGSVFRYGPEGDRGATLNALLERRADASPLITAYGGLVVTVREQWQQLADLEAEQEHLHELLKRCDEEQRRLNGIIGRIRRETGNDVPGPSH